MCVVNNVLLIDDEPANNFYNTYIMDEVYFARKIEVALNGKEALNFLDCKEKQGSRDEDCICPDLIFLDLNMPVMNGFDFLDAYEKLDFSPKSKPILYVLSSSSHFWDKDKVSTYKSVKGFLTKPLTQAVLENLV